MIQNADQLKSPINIIVSRASASAISRIEALGGTVTTRFYSPTSIKRVLRGDSHPAISLQSDAALVEQFKKLGLEADAPEEAKKTAAQAAIMQISRQYRFRLPDATGREDIEYYRDPAHRGYLSHLVKEGESPSLFFKPPREAKDRKKQAARRDAAKASADNRLF